MKELTLTLVVMASICGWAETRTFPSVPWSSLHAEATETAVRVLDAKGRMVFALHAESAGGRLEGAKAEVTPEGLVLESGDCFKRGVGKLVLTSCGIDRALVAGKDAVLQAEVKAPTGVQAHLYYEGHGPKPIGHFYKHSFLRPRGRMRTYSLLATVPAKLDELHIRFDVLKGAGKRILISSFRYGPESELPVARARKAVKPELLFRADFNGSTEASFARGSAKPLAARGLAYAPGVEGEAVRITAAQKSLLKYAIRDNVDPVRGTVAMWVKREWNFDCAGQPWRTLFAFPWSGNAAGDRVGSGALWFWFYGTELRGDPADDEDNYKTCSLPTDGRWTHVVFTWDEEGVRLFVNGRSRAGKGDGTSPMIEALKNPMLLQCTRENFTEFTVGSRGDSERIDGLIDDFRVYSAPLGPDAVKALFREHAPAVSAEPPPPNYAQIFAKDGANRFERADGIGNGLPGEMELVEDVRLDAAGIAALKTANRFNAVGPNAEKELHGVPYFETGAHAGNRAAFRFAIDPKEPLHCFEFDYPDDALRTADIIVQPCKGSDYVMQVGYAAGDEYPNTGKILTHRCLYWAHAKDVAVVLMTARENAPAALSAIRHYRVKSQSLPVATVSEPKPNGEGWRRQVALYFEDPAINYDFGLDEATVASPTGVGELIDRTAALMKYTGENLLAYPGAWYHGLINADYNPRGHAPDFLRAWYVKFGKEGLGLMPTVNPNTMPIEDGLVSRLSMSNGALHPTEIAIHDTGKPNWGHWHDSPPNFNFHHPKVRAHIRSIIDTLVAQGRDYPAFKGVCMHMTRHCMLWFGDAISGYNDYTVKAFAAEKGIDLPFEKFAANPLRGKDYAEWIKAHCWETWIQWRCDLVTAFYAEVAHALAAARPDLKLWLNSFVPADTKHPDFCQADYMNAANRRCGLDGPALTKAAPNIILCQTLVPADYRWRDAGRYPTKEAHEHQRVLDTLPGFYSLLQGADFPWVNQHDRYWESAIGRSGGSLTTSWMNECGWRVSTLNPSGRHALRHFVLPLRYSDVLGLSKGGFLIGTYGMEDVLVPFVRAFRSLPAVVMGEVGRAGDVVMRQADFDGKSYFYIVNTGMDAAEVNVAFPSGTVDLVSGQKVSSGSLPLKSYEMRAYRAPSGRPQLR